MAMISYGLARNVDATDSNGKPVKIALAVVEHENGHREKVAIPEGLITFAGESIIPHEIARKVRR